MATSLQVFNPKTESICAQLCQTAVWSWPHCKTPKLAVSSFPNSDPPRNGFLTSKISQKSSNNKRKKSFMTSISLSASNKFTNWAVKTWSIQKCSNSTCMGIWCIWGFITSWKPKLMPLITRLNFKHKLTRNWTSPSRPGLRRSKLHQSRMTTVSAPWWRIILISRSTDFLKITWLDILTWRKTS